MAAAEAAAVKNVPQKQSTREYDQRAGVRERLRHGRDRRNHISRLKLGEVQPRKRTFQAIGVLLSATEGRLPALLPIKYQRMSANPFAFFRGAVSIMAADFSNEPQTGLRVQLCGDAHVQNLGCFATPDGSLVFDINDFDETVPGPWEWDVKRMATSIVLAGEMAGHGGSGCEDAVRAFAASYCATIEMLADQPILTAARHQIHRVRKAGAVAAAWEQAARATPCDLLKKYIEDSKGRPCFKEIKNALWRVAGKEKQAVLDSLPLYRKSLAPDRLHFCNFFTPVDVGFKVVGTGSVGLRDYIVLMDGNGPDDPLFLQIKQEVSSAYAPYLRNLHFASQGERVVLGQRRIQPNSDLILGWTRMGEHDFLVRQLNDHKGAIDLAKLRGPGLRSLAEVAGELLARGHTRSGDAVVIKGYIGSPEKVVRAIVNYAVSYAQVTRNDFELFTKAIKDGKVKVAAA
ncbi:MAG TPA: DUF2252 domain-containing protein [Bryobacteraceae bacterium]|jgi:uncharacterized protein (DUF2252 family)|nr:DUF2252 domain-containing protein [Bryobacteraceae bacterium]